MTVDNLPLSTANSKKINYEKVGFIFMKGKKFLTGLLSAAMVIGSVAVPVFADDNSVKNQEELVALAQTADKENANVIIDIADNFALSTGIRFVNANTVTINGNGHTITMNNVPDDKRSNYANSYSVNEGERPAGLVITDGYKAKEGSTINVNDLTIINNKAKSDTEGGILYSGGAHTQRAEYYTSLYAENVNYTEVTFDGGVCVTNNSSFDNCKFSDTSKGRYLIFVANQYGGVENIKVDIKDCAFDGKNSTYGGIKVADDTNKGANVSVADSTFENIVNKPAMNVNGKTLVASSGNTFTGCTEGEINGGAKYTAAAKIGDTLYTTLEEAMKVANSGDTIDIVTDITFDKVDGDYGKALINVEKADNFNLTINGNGHKISTGVVLSQIDAQGAPYVPSISIKSSGGSLTVDNVVMPENLKFKIYGTEAAPADSLTIQNCTMNGSILDYMETTKNITYDNNNFAVNKNQYTTENDVYPIWYKMQNKAAVESFTFTNNNVDFPRGIQLSNLPENMKINVTGNTFDIHNAKSEKNSALMIGAGQSADKQFNGEVVFSQNTVTAKNGSALCIYSPSDDNTGFKFNAVSNIVAGGAKLVGYNSWSSSYGDQATKEAAEALVNKVLKNVNGSENYADTIDLEFVPTTDERVYNIVLSGNSKDINRLNAAEFTFKLDTTDKITYEIAAAEKMSLIPDYKTNKFEFHFDGKDNIGDADTATAITIGTVTFDGFGKFSFEAKEGRVAATTVADNLVTEFVVNGGADKGTLKIEEGANKIPETTISVPQRKLTINIAMNHPVIDNVTAYQDMQVEISGGNLGTDTKKYKLGTDGTPIVNGVYTIEKELDENGFYTVTVKGAGYRTARYTVTMTEDKIMNLWNNVMSAPTEVVDGADKTKTNFLAGDIINDGNINIYDLSAVVAYFNADKTMDTTKYEKLAKYDLNRDGKIDMMDISIVLTSWNN